MFSFFICSFISTFIPGFLFKSVKHTLTSAQPGCVYPARALTEAGSSDRWRLRPDKETSLVREESPFLDNSHLHIYVHHAMPCNAMQCLFVFASVLPRKSKFLLQNEALLRSFNPEAYEKAMNSAETGPAFQNHVLGSAGGCTLEMSDEELVCLHIYKRSCLGHGANWCKLMQIAKMPRIMQLLLLIWHVFCFWSISQCIHRITVKDGPQNWNFKNILKYWLVRFTKRGSEPQHCYQRVHSS